eukprot:6881366-Prymnesium_polylepis.1
MELPDDDNVVVSLGAQAWHTDGPVNLFGDDFAATLPPYALNVFFPLVDLHEANGPTEFALGARRFAPCTRALALRTAVTRSSRHARPGSHRPGRAGSRTEDPVSIAAPAGSAVLFDYRLWHRGLSNSSEQDRPVLYAVVARAWFHDFRNHRHAASLFGGTAAPCPRLPLGGRVAETEHAARTSADSATGSDQAGQDAHELEQQQGGGGRTTRKRGRR